MFVQGRAVKRNDKLVFNSISAGRVLVKATLVWDHCVDVVVTSKNLLRKGYPKGWTWRVQEGSPWLEWR